MDNLLYFNNFKKDLYLYLLILIEVEVFKLVYDDMGYFDYVCIYERLIDSIYIYNIAIKLYKYLRYCSYY